MGIDTPGEGKNLVGAFHCPVATIVDVLFLETLPKREWICGLGEVLKTALVIEDPELWDLLKVGG